MSAEDPAKSAAQAEIDALTKGIDDGAPLAPKDWGYEPSSDEKTMALLAHLSCIFGAFIVPGILLIVKGNESPFIRYHAIQALVYQAALFTFNMVIVVPIAICTFGLGGFLALAGWIPGVMWALKANGGEWAGYPMIENIGKK